MLRFYVIYLLAFMSGLAGGKGSRSLQKGLKIVLFSKDLWPNGMPRQCFWASGS